MPFAVKWVIIFLIGAGLLSAFTRKLTWPAAAMGIVLAIIIYKGCGYTGITMLALFFVLGTAATGLHAKQKGALKIEEANNGRRTTGQVIANAGIAGICGLLAWQLPQQASVFCLMIAGSFSAATADTLSSELGNVFGRHYYNIITLKKDERGLNGVVSLQGTLFGVAGSVAIAIIHAIGFGWGIHFIWVILAGTIGNFTDSILGATLERQSYLNNNAVNVLNTLVGAAVCFLCYYA